MNTSADKSGRAQSVKGVTKESGFVSFQSVYEEALNAIDQATTVDAHNAVLNQYKDVITLKDSLYAPVIMSPLYRFICNRNGVYFADGYAHKLVQGSKIVVTKLDNAEKLNAISNTDNLNDEIFRIFDLKAESITSAGRTNANCGTYLEAMYYDNPSGCKNDRRVYINAYTEHIVSGDYYTPYVSSVVWGTLRTGTFCNWKDYSTVLSARNCSYTVTSTVRSTETLGTNADSVTGTGYSLTVFAGTLGSPALWQVPLAIPTIQFTGIHAEANSQGVGSNWAVIHCY